MSAVVREHSITHLGFLQFEIAESDIQTNLKRVREGLAALAPPEGSLIALPEMWATGFAYEDLAALSEAVPSLLQELEELAASHQVVLAGSLPWRQNGDNDAVLSNTLFFSGTGSVPCRGIDKQHLFSFWNEDRWFRAGNRPEPLRVTDSDRVGGLVCYDLRFPEAAQLQCRQGAMILLMSAQWPKARIEQWKILLRARAIENRVYVVAANACGSWNDIEMGGNSLIIAPDGEMVAAGGEGVDSSVLPLDRAIQVELRNRFNTVAPAPWSRDDGDKILPLDELAEKVLDRKRAGQKIVFTNGCFDIVHAGHVEYLQQARRQGDFLVVGLNSDQSIRSIKGPERPVNEERERARVLAALGCVDAVVLFGEDTPINLITTLSPDVLVKGADWEEDDIVGGPEVKAGGGRVERIPFVTQTSTSDLIRRIRSTD